MNEQMDDHDLEVSPLASPSVGPPSIATDSAGSPHAPSDHDAVAPESGARHVSVLARRSRTQRLVRTVSVAALLTLLVTAVLLVPVGNRDVILRVFTPPTPSPTALPQPGDNAFLWEHTVPWGQMLIDGKPGPNVNSAAITRDGEGFPVGVSFHLSRGRHTLAYYADRFPTLRCTVSVPHSRDDTCPLNRADSQSFVTSSEPLTRVLDLQATIDQLAPADTQALIQATQAQLSALADALPRGVLAVGDHYLDAQGHLRQATPQSGALTIATQFHLSSSIESYVNTTCVTLCTRTGLFEDYSAKGWALLAPVDLAWRYSAADGQVVLEDGPSGAPEAKQSLLIPITANVATVQWQISIPVYGARQTDPVLCVTGDHYREVIQVTPGQSTITGQTFDWPYVASTAELGCLYAGSVSDLTTGKPTGPIALVLYRAGALLAVNDAAHQAFPLLPLASAHERALAQAVAPTSLE